MLATDQILLELHMYKKELRKHTVFGNVSWILSSFSTKIELPFFFPFSFFMRHVDYIGNLATRMIL